MKDVERSVWKSGNLSAALLQFQYRMILDGAGLLVRMKPPGGVQDYDFFLETFNEHFRRKSYVVLIFCVVLAFEEDGFARDVTPRYAREYGAKVAKVQQGGKGRKEWWERILNLVKRPYRLVRRPCLFQYSFYLWTCRLTVHLGCRIEMI